MNSNISENSLLLIDSMVAISSLDTQFAGKCQILAQKMIFKNLIPDTSIKRYCGKFDQKLGRNPCRYGRIERTNQRYKHVTQKIPKK